MSLTILLERFHGKKNDEARKRKKKKTKEPFCFRHTITIYRCIYGINSLKIIIDRQRVGGVEEKGLKNIVGMSGEIRRISVMLFKGYC